MRPEKSPRARRGALLLALVSLSVSTGLSLGPEASRARAQGPEASVVDAGRLDAGRLDAGRLDAGRLDAGRAEAGRVEAGTSEAGVLDAGLGDAAVLDASAPDAGTDAGVVTLTEEEGDGGLVDAAVAITREPTTAEVIRTILGLMFLLTLAWLGGLPSVRRMEERLGISQVVTSGLPFVGLGALMHAPGIDVLNEDVLTRLTPLLQFGLGWIGFHTGFQFEARSMDDVPRGTGSVVVLLTTVPFVLIASVTALLLIATGLGVTPEGLHDHDALITLARDAIILGLAGALSAPIAEGVAKIQSRVSELAGTVAVLDDVVAVAALALLAAWLRPSAATGWQLPGVGWLFVTLGMAATLGLVVHFSLRTAESTGERTSLLLGSVALTAGLAGYASIPPLVVCFLAGLVLRNLPGGNKHQLELAFTRLERPIYLLFLVIVGALWRIDDGRGWLLLVAFVVARIGGRYLGARAARRLPETSRPAALDTTPDRELVLAPMGQLAIALVVTAQTLYASPAIRATVTAVVGGSILAEILVRVNARKTAAESTPPAPPSDEPVEIIESDAPRGGEP